MKQKSEKTLYIARNLNHAPFRKIVVTLQRFRDNLDKIFETRQNVLREKRQTKRSVEKFDDRLTLLKRGIKRFSRFVTRARFVFGNVEKRHVL